MLEKFRASLGFRLMPAELKKEMAVVSGVQLSSSNTSNPPVRGTAEILQAYNDMPWLRAVTHKVGHAVGTTQWKLFTARNGSGKATKHSVLQFGNHARRAELHKAYKPSKEKLATSFTLNEIDSHPILDLLMNGNDKLLGQSIFQLTQVYLDLVGEAFWIMERNALGMPIGIWPLPPHWIRDFPKPDRLYYSVVVNGRTTNVPMTEIIPFVDPNPVNPYGRGSGTAKALGDELETDEYASKHIKSYFYNSAKPELIISGAGLGRADTKSLEEKWLQKHQGFWNKFKPHFINREVEVTELGQSFQEMGLNELRKNERDTIMQVYGLPPEKLGVLTASNRSTILSADLFFNKDVLMPRIELIRATLQKFLVPLYDDKLILEFESPVVDDRDLKTKVMIAQPAAFSKDEFRTITGLEPWGEEGQYYILQAGQTQVKIGEQPPAPVAPAAPTATPKKEDNSLEIRVLTGLDTKQLTDSVLDKLGKALKGSAKEAKV